jgi:hypothetical protein
VGRTAIPYPPVPSIAWVYGQAKTVSLAPARRDANRARRRTARPMTRAGARIFSLGHTARLLHPGPRAGRAGTAGDGKWDATAGDDTLTGAFGRSTDIPVAGDWNGDGTDEIGVWRPSVRKFLLNTNGIGKWDGTAAGGTLTGVFGLDTDIPVTGRW